MKSVASRIGRYLRKSLVSLLLLPVYVYRYALSPMLPPSCRFIPTCSEYAIEALRKHGVLRGSWLTMRRLLRCRPGGGSGYDPVP
jgi:putative membrane protein insertion efficiency factor